MAMTWTRNTSIRGSASLAADATATYDIDVSTKYRVVITFLNTPGASISTTRGVRCDVFWSYGSTPTPSTVPMLTKLLASAAASTLESDQIVVEPGTYRLKITNTDLTYATTVGILMDTLDAL